MEPGNPGNIIPMANQWRDYPANHVCSPEGEPDSFGFVGDCFSANIKTSLTAALHRTQMGVLASLSSVKMKEHVPEKSIVVCF